MSDNVTPLHPEKERKKRTRKRIFTLVGILLLVCGALSLILFHQELNLDRLRRYVNYLGTENSGTYGEYSFDAHGANAYSAFENGLALASVAGLEVYDDSGEALCVINKTMSVPALAAGKKTVLAYDVGGTALCVAGAKDGELLNLDTPKPILDADISQDDQICYAAAADGYKTVLTVLDEEQKEIYRWLSSSQYLPLCAVANGAKRMAAVSLGQENGSFASSLVLFATDQEEPIATTPLGSDLIYDLEYVNDKTLCAVGESSLQLLDAEGQGIGTYSYGDAFLKDFSLSGNGFIALSMNRYKAGNHFSLVTVDYKGEELANLFLGEEVLSVSAAGNYVAVLSAGKLRIYTADLTLYNETTQVFGASDVVMRSDGSAILIGAGSAKLYLP